MHGGHIGQLLRAYQQKPFTRVVILVDKRPEHKPHATPWRHRLKIAELTFAAFDSPFDYEIMSIENSLALKLHESIDYKITGIDSLVDNLGDPSRLAFAQRWPMVVLSIPGVEQVELTRAITALPEPLRKSICYEYVGPDIPMMNYDFDEKTFMTRRVHATDLREGKEPSLMPLTVRAYIRTHRLYDRKA